MGDSAKCSSSCLFTLVALSVCVTPHPICTHEEPDNRTHQPKSAVSRPCQRDAYQSAGLCVRLTATHLLFLCTTPPPAPALQFTPPPPVCNIHFTPRSLHVTPHAWAGPADTRLAEARFVRHKAGRGAQKAQLAAQGLSLHCFAWAPSAGFSYADLL